MIRRITASEAHEYYQSAYRIWRQTIPKDGRNALEDIEHDWWTRVMSERLDRWAKLGRLYRDPVTGIVVREIVPTIALKSSTKRLAGVALKPGMKVLLTNSGSKEFPDGIYRLGKVTI